MNLPHRINEFAAADTFQQITGRPRLQKAEDKLVIIIGGQYQYRYLRIKRLYLPGRLDTIDPGHGDIDDSYVRLGTPGQFHGFFTMGKLLQQANVAAAETLEKKSLPLIYRVHDEPTMEKLHAHTCHAPALHRESVGRLHEAFEHCDRRLRDEGSVFVESDLRVIG